MIRIDEVWLALAPVDMRAGADRLLASVVQVFGAAQAITDTCSPTHVPPVSSCWCTTASASGALRGG